MSSRGASQRDARADHFLNPSRRRTGSPSFYDGGRRTRRLSDSCFLATERIALIGAYDSLRRRHDLWKGHASSYRKPRGDRRKGALPRATRSEPRAGSRLGGLALPFRLSPVDVRQVPVRRFGDLAIANRPNSITSAKLQCRSTKFNYAANPSEAHPRITARSERTRLHHPIGGGPGRVTRSALAFQPDTGLGRAAVCRAHPGRAISGWRLPLKVAPLAFSWKPGVNIARSAGTSSRAGD
jgi:hypothetical protein